MKTLSNLDLLQVTGGKPDAALDTTGGSSSNDQLLGTLQNIQSSLDDLGKNQNQGLFGGQSGPMFMTMALAMSRRSDVVVCGGGGCRRGPRWRVW